MNNFSAMWDFPIMDQVTLEYASDPSADAETCRTPVRRSEKGLKRCQSRTVWQFPGVPLQQPERY